MITHKIDSDPKSKQDKLKVTNLKICQKFLFWNCEKKSITQQTF